MKIFTIFNKTDEINSLLKTYFSSKSIGVNNNLIIFTDSEERYRDIKQNFSVKNVIFMENLESPLDQLESLDLKENESFIYIKSGLEMSSSPFRYLKSALSYADFVFCGEKDSFDCFAGNYIQEVRESIEDRLKEEEIKKKLQEKESSAFTLPSSFLIYDDIVDFKN